MAKQEKGRWSRLRAIVVWVVCLLILLLVSVQIFLPENAGSAQDGRSGNAISAILGVIVAASEYLWQAVTYLFGRLGGMFLRILLWILFLAALFRVLDPIFDFFTRVRERRRGQRSSAGDDDDQGSSEIHDSPSN